MRTVSRLRLLFFSFYDYRCRAVHSVTLCPVETMQAHHNQSVSPLTQSTVHSAASLISVNDSKNHCFICCHIQTPYGGPGGICTPVQNTFLFASYSNNLQYIFILGVCQLLWR